MLAIVGESGSGKTTLARTPDGAGAADPGRGALRGRPLDYSFRALKRYRSRVQMVLQDAAGSLNPRQTVYESVAEGIRLHRLAQKRRAGSLRDRPGRRRDGRGRAAAAGAAVPALPARAVRRPEAAGADRRRARAAPRAGARRRAGLLPRRLDPRRDPRAAAPAARGAGDGRRGGHPRPRPGLEHRGPDRGDVPRPGRRVRHHRGGARPRPQHPYTRALLSVVPEIEQLEPVVLDRRDPGPEPDPVRLPVPPALPAAGRRLGRAGGRRGGLPGRAARRCCPRPASTGSPATSTPRSRPRFQTGASAPSSTTG